MQCLGTKNFGMFLLAIWLIATGVLALVRISFAQIGLVLAALAVAAGVFAGCSGAAGRCEVIS